MTGWQAPPADVASVAEWLDAWGQQVASVDFESARGLFRNEVIGFGTWMDLVEGLDELECRQWRSIWPAIRHFHHDTKNSLRVTVSPDRLMAVGLVIWTSTGFDEDGRQYDRPGRTTVLLTRDSLGSPWRALHTHVSLFRGVPQRSHGAPGTAEES